MPLNGNLKKVTMHPLITMLAGAFLLWVGSQLAPLAGRGATASIDESVRCAIAEEVKARTAADKVVEELCDESVGRLQTQVNTRFNKTDENIGKLGDKVDRLIDFLLKERRPMGGYPPGPGGNHDD